jgi:hypothetical protein
MKTLRLFLVTSLAGAAILRAEPCKVSNLQAQQLYAALNSIDAGLTAANTTLVADDINALLPKVDAFEKGNAAAQKKYQVTSTTKADDPSAEKYLEEVQANADAQITIDLARLKLSDDEITAAKIRPSVLAVIRKWLVAPATLPH